MDTDLAIRLAAFKWLAEQVTAHGDVLPRTLLQEGFEFEGTRIPLVSPQGIFKPQAMDFPLTITTTPEGPYSDSFAPDGLLAYRYRGTDPNHPDNVGLREALSRQRPLIYFHGIVPGKYLAVWPVYAVADDPSALTFRVAVDDIAAVAELPAGALLDPRTSVRRAYVTRTVKARLHQRSFRERVLAAYRSQCALCRLRHLELLDAAHFIPDPEPEGEPRVTNGIALCTLHHGAFDAFILGISPDFKVHIRQDVLSEEDGPTLKYALQALDGITIALPQSRRDWPSRDALDWRFDRFKAAA
jgi:putative restriction endonuclease